MEAAIIIGMIYLTAVLALSAEDFIKTASSAIALTCLYLIGKVMENDLIFPACIISIIALQTLSGHMIGTNAIATFALIASCSAFWLSTEEFVDGYVYSHIYVSLFAALCADILLPFSDRRNCCILSVGAAFLISYVAGTPIDSRAFAASMTVCWIFCTIYPDDHGHILGIDNSMRPIMKYPNINISNSSKLIYT